MEVLILIGLLLYFLPTIVAESWKKQNADAIFLLNFGSSCSRVGDFGMILDLREHASENFQA